MEFTTTVEEFPKYVRQRNLTPDTEILVTLKDSSPAKKVNYVQVGDKSAFEDFEAVEPEPGARLVSDIVYEQRKQ